MGKEERKTSKSSGLARGNRPNLDAYNKSPGDSNAKHGSSLVKATREARAPPREWLYQQSRHKPSHPYVGMFWKPFFDRKINSLSISFITETCARL